MSHHQNNSPYEQCVLDHLSQHDPGLIQSTFYLLKTAQEQNILDITNLKLQKLVYYSHIHHLVKTKQKEAIINSSIEAWPYGPVIPKLYFLFIGYQTQPIRIDFSQINFQIDVKPSLQTSIKYILKKYGSWSSVQLTDKSHTEDPWINAWRLNQRFEERIIPQNNIYEYYRQNKL
ncbi:Panacea domain-containing protein [Candidatus Phytoplasma pruni]|uniref:DUF4065 domain-containing protein n=1 Tax=Candidatus Phytoplasma pruni TaxID=479893 RepID=A0A851HAG5_9MOLU|nr:type II toxin-antitoxin system antitoxin SocA domain-containing protein [Candidatus Phytoplasma pruni]NWN45887.1 DUF4065 domain-containing protein [Candidatus Phytoplasma pruni]